jgi:hypothetical protein
MSLVALLCFSFCIVIFSCFVFFFQLFFFFLKKKKEDKLFCFWLLCFYKSCNFDRILNWCNTCTVIAKKYVKIQYFIFH